MITIDSNAPPWARQMVDEINAALNQPPRKPAPTVSVTNLPRATPAGQTIYIPDEAGGPTLAFSDGTNWLRNSDNAVVS